MMIRFGQGNEATKRKAIEEDTRTSRKSQRRPEATQLTDGTSAFMQSLPHDQFNRQHHLRPQTAETQTQVSVIPIKEFLAQQLFNSHMPRFDLRKDPLTDAESTFTELDSKDKPLKGDAANAMIARHIIAVDRAAKEKSKD